MFTRSLNGEVSSTWRSSGAEQSAMGVNVATFGCTGHLGHHVHAQCAAHRYTNIAPFRFRAGTQTSGRTIRNCGDGGTLFAQNFETDFELDKEFVVKSILEKVDNVFNVIGAWQEPALYENSQSWFSMEGINVEWPRMLARWCREMGVLRLVHMSMVGADLNSPSKILRQKAAAEIAVLEEFPNATIIRGTDIYYEEDYSYSRYLKAQKHLKFIPVVNHGNRIHQPLFAGDLAEAAVRSILLDHTQGRIAELGGPVRFTTTDFARWVSEVNGLNNYIIHLPKWAWKAIAAFNERGTFHKGALIGTKPPAWNQDWVERQFVDNCAMPERDPELLDWEDFGIPREDLYRMEEKYFVTSGMWAKDNLYQDYNYKL